MLLLQAVLANLALFYITTQALMAGIKPCLRVEGVVIDYATHQPLQNAQLFAKLSTGRTKVSVTTVSGNFSGDIPCEAVALLIEKVGYRPQVLPLQSSTLKHDELHIVFLIPLIAVEQQANDQIYLQTEQTDYVQQNNTEKSMQTDRQAVQHGTFFVTDAIRKTPLRAKLCLIFTKTGERKCIDTDVKGKFSIDFDQTDIIAVEATVTGYQPYEGNLIIESLDGRYSIFALQLQRELTILAVDADLAIRCDLLGKNKKYSLRAVPGHTSWYSSYAMLSGPYELIIKHPQGTTRQVINLREGLNYISSNLKPKVNLITASTVNAIISGSNSKLPLSFVPDGLPLIYFEQGSYTLRMDSQEVLRQVARYLKNNKNYVLQVAGHTDNVGDERLNKSLSEFRAAVAMSFLIRQGITERQCTKAGFGSQLPVAPNDTEANKAMNRRVSLKLIATQ